jgi:hypothetical protein
LGMDLITHAAVFCNWLINSANASRALKSG